MPTRFLRLVARPKDIEEDQDDLIVIDIIIGEDKKIKSDRPFFGYQGKLGGDQGAGEYYPFVLRRDGVIDFGLAFNDRFERLSKTTIRNWEINLGMEFSLQQEGEEYIYKVVKLAE